MIFMLSAQNGSESHETSEKFIKFIMNIEILKCIYEHIYRIFNVDIREQAHIFEYFLLGLFTSLSIGTHHKLKKLKKFTISLTFSTFYMLTDLIHQYFVPGRGISLHEASLDLTGVIIGIAIVTICDIMIYLKSKYINRNQSY